MTRALRKRGFALQASDDSDAFVFVHAGLAGKSMLALLSLDAPSDADADAAPGDQEYDAAQAARPAFRAKLPDQ